MFVALRQAYIPTCTRSISMYQLYIMIHTIKTYILKIDSSTKKEIYRKLVT